MAQSSGHKPVFLNKILEVFATREQPVTHYFDGTFGRGGHTKAILNHYPQAQAWVSDGDQAAIDYGRSHFADLVTQGRLHLAHSSYREFVNICQKNSWPAHFDLMLLDLGVSSPQLDEGERGFSFYQDGPLDMRMDRSQELSAAHIINNYEEQDLARIFIELGEVQKPFRVVRAIVSDRKSQPFHTTQQLASLIERVDGWQKKGSHPATKYFLGLRLHVNAELTTLQDTLPILIDHLSDHGLLAVITFHSLEDRIVKNIFREAYEKGEPVQRKVIKPSEEEVADNPRARSAKLRVFRRYYNRPLTKAEVYAAQNKQKDHDDD
jgi:16S rRNA (cytosine1402-N4)-methyltransferase